MRTERLLFFARSVAVRGMLSNLISEERAKSIARKYEPKSTHPHAKHVALMVRGSRIIKIHVNWEWNHAERRVIRATPKDLRKECVLYSLRIAKSGELRNAEPCEPCRKFIEQEGIKLVQYSNEEGNIVELLVA